MKVKEGKTMKTLKETACGQSAKVKKLHGEGPVRRRIMDMGIEVKSLARVVEMKNGEIKFG